MYELRKILIPLDLTPMDDVLIRYTFTNSQILHTEKLILMHVVGSSVDLDKIEEGDGGEKVTLRESLKQRIEATIKRNTNQKFDFEVQYEIAKGERVSEILSKSKAENADLIILGRKAFDSPQKGLTSKKIARKALCSVLCITENAHPEINKILIPVDFSEFSKRALERALNINKYFKNLEIVCLNIYTLPNGYLASGKSQSEFAEIMMRNAERRYNHFIKEYDISEVKISARFQLDKVNLASKLIYDVALVERADLIMIGSRGRTNIAAAFLGSTTEKLLRYNINIPTLVVKNKNQNLGFFDAILNI